MGLLSGGERSLGALAFLFALMLARPSPFYVLDEVDAALDDANISRFLELIERYRERAQFIIITHQQLTMEIADTLYGVSMAGDGVSTVLSRRAREPVAALVRGRAIAALGRRYLHRGLAPAPERPGRRPEGAAGGASSRACARISAAPAVRSRRASTSSPSTPTTRASGSGSRSC